MRASGRNKELQMGIESHLALSIGVSEMKTGANTK